MRLLPVHPAQRTFLHLDRLVNTNSCDVAVVRGRVDPEALREAIVAALARHPLANATLRGDRWAVAEAPLPVDLRVEALDDDDRAAALDHVARHTWRERIDLTRSRPVRFLLLHTPTRSWVCAIGPHATTDARAGARLIHDIAAAATALAEGRAPDRSPIDTPDRSLGLWFGRLGLAERLRLYLAGARSILRDVITPGAGLGAADAPPAEPRVALRDLGAERLAAVRAAATARGVTLHALVVLALARARARREAGGPLAGTPLRFADLVSLRPYADAPVDDLWDTLVVPHVLTVPGTDPAALDAVRARLDALKAGAVREELARLVIYDALARVVPVRWAARLVFRLVTRTNLVLTNPGVIPYPVDRLGTLEVEDVFSFPRPIPPGRLVLSLTTFRGRLRLVVLHDPAAFPEGVDRLVDDLVAELDAMTAPARRAAG